MIPVFGVDATDGARTAIADGEMVGTIQQDGEGMATAMVNIVQNFLSEKDALDGLDADNIIGTWRVNIPYHTYTGEESANDAGTDATQESAKETSADTKETAATTVAS